MSLYIKSEQTDDVVVVQCAGRMVRGEALRLLKGAVITLTQSRIIVLDLAEVKMLDAGGSGCWSF